MVCCGRKRLIQNKPSATSGSMQKPMNGSRPQNKPPSRLSASPVATASLRYLKQGGLVVRGPVTGQQYSFTAVHPVQTVDKRDAEHLLRTSRFRLTWGMVVSLLQDLLSLARVRADHDDVVYRH